MSRNSNPGVRSKVYNTFSSNFDRILDFRLPILDYEAGVSTREVRINRKSKIENQTGQICSPVRCPLLRPKDVGAKRLCSMAVIDIDKIETRDEVIQEVRKIKDDLARAFSYDIKKMLNEARTKQKASGRTVLSPPAKKDA